MIIGIEIFRRLSGHAGVVAVCGDRIYPKIRPQDDPLPACVYEEVAPDPNHTHDGRSHSEPLIQVSCFATSYFEAQQLKEAVIASMESWSDATVLSALQSGGHSDYDEGLETFQEVLEFTVIHQEE